MTGTTTENTQFTVFGNEACEAVKIFDKYVPNTYSVPQTEVQDIKDYFARPRLINRGTIPFGSYDPLQTVGFDGDMARLRAIFPQWNNRLAGAHGIRFTLNFKLQVAATSFHQGILAMCWQFGDNATGGTVFDRTQFSYAATNLPHVRLDLSEQTMVELKIPFLYTSEFMETIPNADLTDYLSDYGELSVIPILPVVSVAGLTVPTFDLYCYLTDIELFGVDVINPNLITIQSDVLTKEVKESRVVSGTLKNMAKISRFVSRGVPSLAAMAGPAAWALDTAAGIAKYFGYAKPMVQDPPRKVYKSEWASDHHVDVPMTGEVVGMFQGNSTTVSTTLGATEVDEMALAYVTKQWSQVLVGGVTTGNTHGTAVYATPVSPSVFYFRRPSAIPFSNRAFPINSSSGYAAFMPSSLMYISSFFRLWRGSIKFRITFAKTKLHGGRYMATFVPYHSFNRVNGTFGGAVLGTESVSGLNQPYGNSMIMDLKDGNVFEFTCPYEMPFGYCNFTSGSGGFSITCIDPLQSTGTVTTSVPFLVEVCGGDDFELADYAGPFFVPHPNASIQIQSGDLVRPSTVSPAEHTIGERITSLKQIIMQPYQETLSVTGNNTFRFRIAPWFANVNYPTSSTSITNPNTVNLRFHGSPGAALAKCYAFVKGGTDIHAYPESVNVVNMKIFQFASEFFAGTEIPSSMDRRPFVSSTPKVVQYDTALHARLPSYQVVARIPAAAYDRVFNGGMPTSVTETVPIFMSHLNGLNIQNLTGTTRRIFFNRSASDDAAMAHYMGPVPVFVPNSASTQPLDINATGF
jgi:hypothetical protein